MTFKVIDTKTGKEPTRRVIDNIAKKGNLMFMDIDQFFVGEDGQIVLADDCGRIAYLDMEQFETVLQISDGATNGDVIKSIFGADKVFSFIHDVGIRTKLGNSFSDCVVANFNKEWWNAPYKAESEG